MSEKDTMMPALCRFDGYQEWALTTAGPQTVEGTGYLTMKLAGEAGETADKLAKLDRDCGGVQLWKDVPSEKKAPLVKEMGDVLWYTSVIASRINKALSEVAEADKFEDFILMLSEGKRIAPCAFYLVQAAASVVDVVSLADNNRRRTWGSLLTRHEDDIAVYLLGVLKALSAISSGLAIPFSTVAVTNYVKLEGRRDRGTLGGDGDDR